MMTDDGRPVRRARPLRGAQARSSSDLEAQRRAGRRPSRTRTRSAHCYRCGTVVEPLLSTQWFVRISAARRAGDRRGARRPHRASCPEHWEKTYFDWMENIRDWCISRQLWWGHRIPAWYCDALPASRHRSEGARRRPERGDRVARASCGCAGSRAGRATSSTPGSRAACGRSRRWAGPTTRRSSRRYYPTDVLVTGFDIIFFWVARMIMMGLQLHRRGAVPRRLHARPGARRAGREDEQVEGQRAVDPLEVIDELRHRRAALHARRARGDGARHPPVARRASTATAASSTRSGTRRASSLMNVGDGRRSIAPTRPQRRQRRRPLDPRPPGARHRRGRARRSTPTASTTPRPRSTTSSGTSSATGTSSWRRCRSAPTRTPRRARPRSRRWCRCSRPRCACCTRSCRSSPTRSGTRCRASSAPATTLLLTSFPRAADVERDEAAEARVERLVEVVRALRNLRAEMNLPPSREIDLLVASRDAQASAELPGFSDAIKTLARIGRLETLPDGERPSGSALAVAGGLELYVPLAGLIDVSAERERLEREIERVAKELAGVTRKLDNEDFMSARPTRSSPRSAPSRPSSAARKSCCGAASSACARSRREAARRRGIAVRRCGRVRPVRSSVDLRAGAPCARRGRRPRRRHHRGHRRRRHQRPRAAGDARGLRGRGRSAGRDWCSPSCTRPARCA